MGAPTAGRRAGQTGKRFLFSVEFNDAAKLAAILTSHAIAEQLKQDRESPEAIDAGDDEDCWDDEED